MWTPRRILLFLLALLGFGTAYAGYSRLLGSLDGLPQLPERYLAAVNPADTPEFHEPAVSPTELRLIEAFGPNCPEKNYSAYPTQFELRQDGMVVASGRPQWSKEPSRFVKLAPFSVALFGKPRPASERVPGEVIEISTVHSDIAVLEFDRPIGSEADMTRGAAKLVGVELRSEPDRFSPDARNGRVFITNNQRSPDPNKSLVIKSPGPVFYRAPEAPGQPADAPSIWTAAAVQIENRENMPRPLRGQTLAAVAVNSDEGIVGPVVEGMLLGSLTPPPTVTAEGMKIYLKKAKPTPGPQASKVKGPAVGAIRLIELSENVLVSLWTDGAAGFPGSTAQAEPTSAPKAKPDDPPLAAGAVVGGLGDAGVIGQRLTKKALVRIRTLGSFKFDYDTNAARFEVAPQANPLVPNNVEVTRLTAADGRDILVSQLLELELDGPLTQGGPPPATDKQKAATQKTRAAGPSFKAVRATGSYVYLFSAADQLEAQGNSLVYRTGIADPRTPKGTITQTVLTGAPLVSVRQKNKLEAGRTGLDGRLVLTTTEPLPGSKTPPQTVITVLGPGRVELYDAATKATSLRASWIDSLTHTKDAADKKELDLFVFTGGGRFEDPKGTFDLRADTLRLWLQPSAPAGKDKDAGQPLPFRLQGIGRVAGKSADAIIKDTDALNMWFQDVPPPVVPKVVEPVKPTVVAAAPAPAPPQAGPPVPPPPANSVRSPPTPEPQKPPAQPMHLTARSIEAWVSRFPDRTPPKKDAAAPGLKYEIDRARLEERVLVTQAPADPAKNPNGTTITGATLNLTHFPAGHAMTVVGTPDLLAEVRFESVWIAGPKVDIHQPNNTVDVSGRGWLKMPSGSGLNGEVLDKPSELNVAWAERMKFQGERRSAEFLGQVQAEQRIENPAIPNDPKSRPTIGRSYTLCHRMDVGFDRPVMFNQLKSDRERKPNESAKIETVVCSPAAEDGDGSPGLARSAAPVVYAEETFAAGTSKPVKAQRITARGLDVKTTPTSSLMTASGPGESRTLQMGSADSKPPVADPNVRTASKPPAEEEMKLTVVRFAGRLRVDDRKGIFQQAVFSENVRVVSLPTEDINARAEETSPPPRSITLKCTDTLTVSAYRGANGAETRKEMLAVGGAEVKDDTYIGLGHEVAYDGTIMTLTGHNDGQATLYRRQRSADGQDYNSGRKISYDTRTGRVNAIDSSGGSVTGGK